MSGDSRPAPWNLLLSRRHFLGLGAAALALPGGLRWPGGPWSFAVCSDPHFGIRGHLELNRPLLAEIARHGPDLLAVSGDITERGWALEYDDVERAFAPLPYPVHCAPGNHDVRWAPRGLQIFEERVGPPRQVLVHGGCGFVFLDSTLPLSHWGHIGGPQRRWLEGELERVGTELPLFVFLHHPTGREPAAVDDQDAVLELLSRYNTKVIFTGHGHGDRHWEWDGLTHTMGRGLYQGSYQLAEVDAGAGVVRLSRRTAEAPEPAPFAEIALAPGRRPKPKSASGDVARNTTPGDGDALRPLWRRPLAGGVMSHLLLDGGVLYVSDMGGGLSAFDPADGRTLWSAETEGYCHSSPVVAGDAVIVGSADGGVYAFERASGARRWRFATEGPVYASAAVANGIVAIASGDGSVYGIGLEDGASRWRWRLPEGPSAFAQSPAATDGERVYLGAWDQHVYALELASGREAWRYLADERSFYYSPAIGAPALVDGRLFVPSNGNNLHALEAATGRVVWKFTSPSEDKIGYSSPRVVDGRIYIGCLGDAGEVRCLDAADGREIWVSATGSTIYESSPAVMGDWLAIGSVDGTLWLLARDDGRILGSWRFPPGHFLSSPAAEPGRVYAATFAEELVGFAVG
ncbi:MAG TPA: PQQ-binding-like beta-propeller repeat protein [Longimicrobiales bacterium]|nr:PQQ-binding-like beta-propeller repeat protein [Longimicrobiales bacterium]